MAGYDYENFYVFCIAKQGNQDSDRECIQFWFLFRAWRDLI